MALKNDLTEYEEMLFHWEMAKKDPWIFLKYFVCTFDEHEKGPTALEKRFPDKAMYRLIIRAVVEHDVLYIEKSRQVMMTWIMAAFFLYDAMFHPARRHFLQSKKQEDANGILDRCRHIYDRLNKLGLPGLPEAKTTGAKTGTTDKLEFPEIRSILQAIPQGGDVVRSYTLSGLFSDECNHQPEFSEAVAAAMPAIEGGGKLVTQGTANGKTYAYLVLRGIDDRTLKPIGPPMVDSRAIKEKKYKAPAHLGKEAARLWIENKIVGMSDEEFYGTPIEELFACMPGMEYWITAAETPCLRVHYSADPGKDPHTASGKEWLPRAKAKMASSKWEREMEINYDTWDGRPVIANWSTTDHVKDHEYDSDHSVLLSVDFGKQVCLTGIAQYVRLENFNAYQLRFIDEIVLRQPESNTPELARRTRDRLEMAYRRSWLNNNIKGYCDPNGNQRQPSTADKSLDTNVKIFEAVGISLDSRKFGVPESTEIMETVHEIILPNGEPSVVYHPRCTYLISCASGGLHYPTKGKDGYYEKDDEYDHGGDVIRYMIANCFDQYALARMEEPQREQKVPVFRQHTGELLGYRRPGRRGRHYRGAHNVYS